MKNITKINSTSCCGCTACASICPKHAIIMQEDNEGFYSPVLDKNLCVECGLCQTVCPIINPPKHKSPQTVWAAWGKHDIERKKSSSGGLSTILARKILREGGAVVGAVMNNFRVHHAIIEDVNDLPKIQGSKYVQSDMEDCFVRAKAMLDAGRKVMFTGTPCQVAGFKNYLRKDYSNLLSVDVVCHGVPSPAVLRRYVEELKQTYYTASSLTFRDKINGWNPSHAIALYDDRGTVCFREFGTFNVYIRGFLRNIFNRTSCSSCKFTSPERVGDITLADFWKIENFDPSLNDKKGTSLCFLNSQKGKTVFDSIHTELDTVRSCPISVALAGQAQLRGPAKMSPLRKEFFTALHSGKCITDWLEKKLYSVGIMNFHFANNFGAVLVPYSLKKTIEKLGYRAEIINFFGNNPSPNTKFEDFRSNYLTPMSKKLVTKGELQKLSPWWKRIVVGSDQIWRMFDTGIYMLNWAYGKKSLISYAASFGHDRYAGHIDKEEASILLSRFDAISVREKSGVDICKELGADAIQVLDPTLLLTSEDYSEIIGKETIHTSGDYLCTVLLKKQHNENVKNNIFNDFNCAVISALRNESGATRTVAEWINTIKNAKYVVSDSFHGTVFSIIFKKQFVCVQPKNFNGQARIPSLLETLHISKNRIYDSIEKITPACFSESIDYCSVDKYILREREKSLLFLKCALDKHSSQKPQFYKIG